MPTVTAVPTTTATGQWPTIVPAQAESDHHLNEDEGTDAPDHSDYNQSANAGEYEENGGFDFSAIPVGASITRVRVKQRTRTIADEVAPGLTISLRSGGVTKDESSWSVVTGGANQTLAFDFDSPNITRDELVTGFTLRRAAVGGISSPPPPIFEG